MITVIGIGPGHRDYILPVAIQKIESADMVIGASRNIQSVREHCRGTMDFTQGFEAIGQYLRENKEKEIAVIVSGDAGFYSMLGFVKRAVASQWIDVIPGISSLQYIYTKLKKGYEKANWISCHGREVDIISAVKEYSSVGVLTDSLHNSQYIACELDKAGIKDVVIYVGENLSYENEHIIKLNLNEAMAYHAKPLSVVVIEHDE